MTSNPSPAYISRVAAAFIDNGKGVRGDLATVVQAVLLDPEARATAGLTDPGFGKVRDPMLRVTAIMRATGATSASGTYPFNEWNELGQASIGMSPYHAPSVFNFWTEFYSQPGTAVADHHLVGPELQIVNEVSIVGYVNYVREGLVYGWPMYSNDVQLTLSNFYGAANDPGALADAMNAKFVYGTMSATLRQAILNAVTAIPLPTSTGATRDVIDAALRSRVRHAVWLTVSSTDFIVQH